MGSARASTGALAWLALVCGILVAGAVFLWTRDTRGGSLHPEYSVARTDDRGAALLFRLYERAGLKPRAWQAGFDRLREPGLLLLLAPPSPPRLGGLELPMASPRGDFLPHEIRALDTWVAQGNVALLMGRNDNALYHALGLIVDEPEGRSLTPAVPVQPGVLAERVAALQTQTQFGFKYGRREPRNPMTGEPLPLPEAVIPAIPAEQWVELFVKKEGSRSVPQVVAAARGRGLYVAVNDVYPAGNVGLTQGDHARFMLNAARLAPPGGAILFDERHKREVQRTMIGYIRERSLAPALIYALVLAGLLFWRAGTRFGEPQPLVPDARRDSGEYVRAAAQLYQNARMAKEALATLHADFRRRLAGALRMDGLTDLEEVGRRYEMRTGRPGIEARQALVEVEVLLARDRLTDEEALPAARRLAQVDEVLTRRPVAKE